MSESIQEASWLASKLKFEAVTLSRPIRSEGKDVTELRIREPVVEDYEAAQEALEAGKMITVTILVLASCTGLLPSAIRMMQPSDMVKCREALERLGFSPQVA